jgi:hypothetical protein
VNLIPPIGIKLMDGLIEQVMKENEGLSHDEVGEKIDEAINSMLSQEWAVGVMDRGLGHYSYGVVVKEEEETGEETEEEILQRALQAPQLIVKCGVIQSLAEHIVEVHNKALK